MDDNIIKIIKEKFDSLPKEIQEVIVSANYQQNFIEIGKNNNLNIEQLGILERETTMVMMGLIPPENFENEIKKELKLDIEKIKNIVKEINEKIFLKIRELLKQINTREDKQNTNPIEEKQNIVVLNQAGIQILDKKELPAGNTTNTPNRENLLKDIEKTQMIHPMFTDKLTMPVQMTPSKTEHSLNNISKPLPVPVKPNSYLTKKDPYRLAPGE